MENWAPSISLENLRARANFLKSIRMFFEARGVLEVETPALSHATVTDPYLHSFTVQSGTQTYYLQTSPEYAMKRLLAAGSGPIYQICKSFRDDEQGRLHNPEFTMLEWYRPGFTHHELMVEMDALLQTVFHFPAAEKFSYAQVFEKYLELNPHTATLQTLKSVTQQQVGNIEGLDENDRDIWLQLLMSQCIEPHLGMTHPAFIYDYPATQAALSKIRVEDPPVAERFELYIRGVELANGFHELCDATEQRRRFLLDLEKRKAWGYGSVPMDEKFLEALTHGLPNCAGVALGLDRLLMVALNEPHIERVISFTAENA